MSFKQIQHLLAYLGYYSIAVDGKWGSQSIAACKQFQQDYGIDSDGIPGTTTQKMLIGAISGTAVKVPSPSTETSDTEKDFWKSIKYFKRSEPYIACSCGQCGGFPVEPKEKLMRLADAVREAAGKPMVPTSTVRCKKHNLEVGGVSNSRHLLGQAMDFQIPGMTANQILLLVKSQKNVAYTYAIDANTVHMDVIL